MSLIHTRSEENPIEPPTWNEWKSTSLSYLLNKRTARFASGAKLFFSAPKHQWIDVIERFSVSDDSDDIMLEKIVSLLFPIFLNGELSIYI